MPNPDKFTPKEYEAYLALPQWQRDNPDWDEEDEYHAYWAKTIVNWQKQYKEEFQPTIQEWQNAVDYIENRPSKSFDIFVPEKQVAQERLPWAVNALRRLISLLYSNYPQPQYISPAQEFDQYAAALNQNAKIEYKANSFNSLMFDVGID